MPSVDYTTSRRACDGIAAFLLPLLVPHAVISATIAAHVSRRFLAPQAVCIAPWVERRQTWTSGKIDRILRALPSDVAEALQRAARHGRTVGRTADGVSGVLPSFDLRLLLRYEALSLQAGGESCIDTNLSERLIVPIDTHATAASCKSASPTSAPSAHKTATENDECRKHRAREHWAPRGDDDQISEWREAWLGPEQRLSLVRIPPSATLARTKGRRCVVFCVPTVRELNISAPTDESVRDMVTLCPSLTALQLTAAMQMTGNGLAAAVRALAANAAWDSAHRDDSGVVGSAEFFQRAADGFVDVRVVDFAENAVEDPPGDTEPAAQPGALSLFQAMVQSSDQSASEVPTEAIAEQEKAIVRLAVRPLPLVSTLTSLTLTTCRLLVTAADFAPIAALAPGLTSLSLRTMEKMEVDAVVFLRQMARLSSLEIRGGGRALFGQQGTFFTHIGSFAVPAWTRGVNSLRSPTISDSETISFDPSAVSVTNSITRLELSSSMTNSVALRPLRRLRSLASLDLSSRPLTDDSLEELCGTSRLSIASQGTDAPPAIVDEDADLLSPQCGPSIPSGGPPSGMTCVVSLAASLRVLDVSFATRITSEGINRHVPKLHSLEVLKAWCHQIPLLELGFALWMPALRSVTAVGAQCSPPNAAAEPGREGAAVPASELADSFEGGGDRADRHSAYLEELTLSKALTMTSVQLQQLLRFRGTLQRLEISQCDKITDDAVTTLLSFTELSRLSLCSCRYITAAAFPVLAKMPLVSLNLSWMAVVDDDALSALNAAGSVLSRTLTTLLLTGTKVTSLGFLHLVDFPKLTSVSVRACPGVDPTDIVVQMAQQQMRVAFS